MLDAHHGIDLLATALGWLSNVAVIAYAPFAKSWRRALTVQTLLVCVWAAVRFLAARSFGEQTGSAAFYLTVLLETVVFAVITRTLKILLFKLPALKALEAHLREQRRPDAA